MKTIQVQLCRLHQLGLKLGQKLGLYPWTAERLWSVQWEQAHSRWWRSLECITRYNQHKETELTQQCCPQKCKNPSPADCVSYVPLLVPKEQGWELPCGQEICKPPVLGWRGRCWRGWGSPGLCFMTDPSLLPAASLSWLWSSTQIFDLAVINTRVQEFEKLKLVPPKGKILFDCIYASLLIAIDFGAAGELLLC